MVTRLGAGSVAAPAGGPALTVQLGLALVVGALLWLWWPADVTLPALRLWLVALAVTALWTATRGARGLLPRPRALWLSLHTGVLAAALLLSVGWGALLPALLGIHVLWLLAQALLWRELRPREVQVGVVQADTPLLPARGLMYQPLYPGEPIGGLHALLVEDETELGPRGHELLAHARATGLPVWSKLNLDEEISGKVPLSRVRGDWLSQGQYDSGYAPLKRAADVLATVLAAPLLLALLLLVALVVFFTSGRPVLFWQERIGLGGRPFRMVKFRTMRTDSEKRGAAFASQTDARVTPLGALLRKFRLDELPQFYNVLRGEMSIIGPRPEQLVFVADFEENIPLYGTRHWVRPGITGWAQVRHGYADSLDSTSEKLRYDFYYVKHLSPALDLRIVWLTVLTILTGFGSR